MPKQRKATRATENIQGRFHLGLAFAVRAAGRSSPGLRVTQVVAGREASHLPYSNGDCGYFHLAFSLPKAQHALSTIPAIGNL